MGGASTASTMGYYRKPFNGVNATGPAEKVYIIGGYRATERMMISFGGTGGEFVFGHRRLRDGSFFIILRATPEGSCITIPSGPGILFFFWVDFGQR
jgi:hypothetical protein